MGLKNLPILWKIFLLILLVSTIPLILMILISTTRSEDIIQSLAQDKLYLVSHSKADLFETMIGKIKALLENLSSAVALKDYYNIIQSESAEEKENVFNNLLKRLSDLKNSDELIKEVLFVSEFDDVFSTSTGVRKASANDFEPYKLVMKENGTVFAEVFQDGKKIFVLGTPVKVGGTSAKGVMWVVIDSKGLKEKLFGELIGVEDSFSSIVNQNGEILLHSTASLEGQNLGSNDWFKKVISSNEKSVLVRYDVDKIWGRVVYTKTSTGYLVTYGMLEKELFKDATALRIFLLILLFVLSIFALLLGWIISRTYIVKPLKEISEKMKEIGTGNFKIPITYTSKDEIGLVFESLRAMIQGITELLKSSAKTVELLADSQLILSDTSKTLSNFSKEVAKTSEKVDNDAQNTSAAIEEVNSGVEEVSASAQNMAKSAQKLSEMSNSVAQLALAGKESIENINKVILKTEEKSRITGQSVKELAERAQNIGEIVDTINSIAEQTNLLALNAAIEAARAGEAGRGFAVVADEIRKLAEESKQATGKIGEILRGIQERAEKADQQTEETIKMISEAQISSKEAAGKFDEIEKNIRTLAQMVESLAATSQELSASSEEMSSAMDNASRAIMDVTSEIDHLASGVKKLDESSQEVKNQTEQIAQIVKELKDLIQKFIF